MLSTVSETGRLYDTRLFRRDQMVNASIVTIFEKTIIKVFDTKPDPGEVSFIILCFLFHSHCSNELIVIKMKWRWLISST